MATYDGVIRSLPYAPGVAGKAGVVRLIFHMVGPVTSPVMLGAVRTLVCVHGLSEIPYTTPTNCWVREYRFDAGGASSPCISPGWWSAKILALFLERVLKYSFICEYCANGNSFRSYEKSGSFGSFSGSDKYFTDSAAPFTVSDVGKKILVSSFTGWNGGIYKISAFVSSSTVTIDTRTGTTEFPTAESGLSWCIASDSYDMPGNSGDYIRLRSPAGWGIQLFLISSTYILEMGVYVSPNNIWTGNSAKVIGPAYLGFLAHSGNFAPTSSEDYYFHIVSDTSGTSLTVWHNEISYGGNQLISIGSFAQAESGHSSDALLCLVGRKNWNPGSLIVSRNWVTITRSYDDNSSSSGSVWLDEKQLVRSVYVMENAYNAYSTGFSKKGEEINHRTGKNDILFGDMYLQDVANSNNEYEYRGFMPNWWIIRNNILGRTALDVYGVMDMYHINDGIVVPWPGVTPQF